MICEVCKQKNADIVFKTVTGNQVATKAMCMGCAHTMQQDMVKMFLALGFRHDQIDQAQEQEDVGQEMPRFICTHCGRPYNELNDQTMAGCAQCYDAIREDMLQDNFYKQILDDKELEAREAQENQVTTVKDLQLRLLEAVVREEFEEAAQLRDEIKRKVQAEGQA